MNRPVSKQPIPENAKKVFTGVMFDIYQWEQKLFDGSHKTFEKIKRHDTVNVLPVTDYGKIILSIQEQPGTQAFIGSFGGGLEEGEDPLKAAKRELLEESGYGAQEFVLWDAVQFIDKIDWVIYTFIAKGCTKVAEPSPDAGEKIALKFVTFDEYLKIVAQENYRDTEVALKMFRACQTPAELAKTRKLFLA